MSLATAQSPRTCGAIYEQSAKEIVRDKTASLIAPMVLQIGDERPGEREFADLLLASVETASRQC
jgi:hypothetical protein